MRRMRSSPDKSQTGHATRKGWPMRALKIYEQEEDRDSFMSVQ